MSYYFEKPIVDTKEIFTRFLIGSISPLLYEGFFSIYQKAQKIELTYIEGAKVDPSVENPGVLKIFMFLLVGVNKMGDGMIEHETTRIRDNSKCADIFDDLVQSVIKAHIIVLTYNASGKRCKILNEEHHKKISSKAFIHKCYCECARLFHDHAALFWHGYGNHELKENQRIIFQLIKLGIQNAIDHSLPMKEILSAYLSNEYIDETKEQQGDYINIKDMINRDLHPEQQDEGGVRQILDDESSIINHNFSFKDDEDLAALIFDRNAHQTIEEKQSEKPLENIQTPQPTVKISSEKKLDKVTSEKKLSEKKLSEKKISEKVSSEKPKNIEAYETDINKLLANKKKGKISENILKDLVGQNEDQSIKIEKNHADADNFFGDFGDFGQN
jgi:hypothetical protein